LRRRGAELRNIRAAIELQNDSKQCHDANCSRIAKTGDCAQDRTVSATAMFASYEER
jgi:hypothetical protein